MIWLGLAVMATSEALTLFRIEPFWSWNTPIAWTGFILFADAVVYRVRGDSWLHSAPREFAALAFASIPLWVLFEGYNLVIKNWYYTGLPENVALRYFGYAWSFATIWPAIFEGAELVAVSRAGRAGAAGGAGGAGRAGGSGGSTGSGWSGESRWSMLAGAVMLALPFIVSTDAARYMAAPVWLGFIFLLDPINERLGAESLIGDARRRSYHRLINLSLSGFLCGALWEFWNFWSRAKWHYTVPIMENWKIFEMSLPGYFGFPAFALECFTIYVFVRRIVCGPAAVNGIARHRPIAL